MPRTLTEDEFNGVKDAVLQAAPAGMSEADFHRYIAPKFQEALGVAENSPPKTAGSMVGQFLSNAWESLNPVTAVTGMANAVLHPVDTATGMVKQAGQQFSQAKELYQKGGVLNTIEAAGHAAAGAIPIVGPAAAAAGEQIASGDIAGGLGKATGLIAPIVAAPVIAKAIPEHLGAGFPSKLNPAEAAAVRFGEEHGVPLDAATKTGSPTLRAAQKRVANSIGGEGAAERTIAAQEDALKRVSGDLKNQANPGGGYVSPEQAGANVTEGVRALVKSMSSSADQAYGKLRTIEESPAHLERVPTAPNGSRSYKQILSKLESGGETVKPEEIYGLRQVEAELDATPFSKKMLQRADKGNSYEPVPGVGGAGAPVYHEIGQAMTEGSELTRGEMQAAIKKTLETGEWTPAAKGALGVVRKRLKTEFGGGGPRLDPNAPLLGRLEDVHLPVDLTGVKEAIAPTYDRLFRESDLVPLQGGKAQALTALDRIMHSPEHVSASVADAALGDLKTMARTDLPELRTQGQGVAAMAVKSLDKAVREAVSKAGPEALSALDEGRSATIGKYQAGAVLEKFSDEPVALFKKLVAPDDSGIENLRKVREVAPQTIPHVARAFLEKTLSKATAEGGFDRAAGLQADWQKLGPATKKILFPEEGQVADLDHFFLLAKKLAENPNPSGTAHVNNVFNWGSTVISYPLAKLLYTKAGVRALSQNISIAISHEKASAIAKAGARLSLVKATRAAGVDLSAIPKAADREPPEPSK